MTPDSFGSQLSADERDKAMQWVANRHPSLLSLFVKLEAKAPPFKKHMFGPQVTNGVTPVQWWTAQRDALGDDATQLAEQLLTARASSAAVERVFSTFGLVQSDLRNRLGIAKAGKLVFIYKVLNHKLSAVHAQ